jgi:cyclophilin family peptidyl-prolyl cis-trans isomerase
MEGLGKVLSGSTLTPHGTYSFLALSRGHEPIELPFAGNLLFTPSYRGSIFHRVVKGVLIQGGDITHHDGSGGVSGLYGASAMFPNLKPVIMTNKMYNDKPSDRPLDKPGLVCTANKGPHTNQSQFFITLGDCSGLTDRNTCFGRVTSGLEVLERLGNVSINGEDRPRKPVTIYGCGEYDPTANIPFSPKPPPVVDWQAFVKKNQKPKDAANTTGSPANEASGTGSSGAGPSLGAGNGAGEAANGAEAPNATNSAEDRGNDGNESSETADTTTAPPSTPASGNAPLISQAPPPTLMPQTSAGSTVSTISTSHLPGAPIPPPAPSPAPDAPYLVPFSEPLVEFRQRQFPKSLPPEPPLAAEPPGTLADLLPGDDLGTPVEGYFNLDSPTTPPAEFSEAPADEEGTLPDAPAEGLAQPAADGPATQPAEDAVMSTADGSTTPRHPPPQSPRNEVSDLQDQEADWEDVPRGRSRAPGSDRARGTSRDRARGSKRVRRSRSPRSPRADQRRYRRRSPGQGQGQSQGDEGMVGGATKKEENARKDRECKRDMLQPKN